MKRFANTLRVVVLASIAVLALTSGTFAADRGRIYSGETKIGLDINSPSYMDTWDFNEGQVGDRVLISVETTSGSLDPYIVLYPPDGGPREKYTPLGLIDHPLEQSGLYTVVVQDSGYNDEGTYNITLLDLPDGPLTSAEDPDGGPITSGETLSGTIDVASDMDAFQFTGDANDRVLISVETTSGSLYPYIKLYPPDGGPYEAYSSSGLISHQLEQSGPYTIVVHDNGYDDEGTYNITLLDLPDGPLSSLNDPDGGPIDCNETLAGTIDVASDMDAFQFNGELNDRVLISVETTSGSLDPDIELYPPDGGSRETYSPSGLIDHQLERSGLYTIVVHDSGYNDVGTYNITLECP